MRSEKLRPLLRSVRTVRALARRHRGDGPRLKYNLSRGTDPERTRGGVAFLRTGKQQEPMANPNPSPATRFRPGQSGNPGGRPRKHRLTDRIRAMLEDDAV